MVPELTSGLNNAVEMYKLENFMSKTDNLSLKEAEWCGQLLALKLG